MVVDGSGAYLKSPPTPTSLSASDDCHELVTSRVYSVSSCATATSPKGTVTAVLVSAAHTEHVDVYRRQGDRAVLVLTGLMQDESAYQVRVGTVDPLHDGDPKIAVTESVRQSADEGSLTPTLAGYDLIDAPGVVSLHRSLGAGAAQVGADGLVDYATNGPDRPSTRSTLTYTGGHWTVTAQRRETSPSVGSKDPNQLVAAA